ARAAAGRARDAGERLEHARGRARVRDGEERRREDDREGGERPERAEAPRPRAPRQWRIAPANVAAKMIAAAARPQQTTSGMRIAPIAFPCVVWWRATRPITNKTSFQMSAMKLPAMGITFARSETAEYATTRNVPSKPAVEFERPPTIITQTWR